MVIVRQYLVISRKYPDIFLETRQFREIRFNAKFHEICIFFSV